MEFIKVSKEEYIKFLNNLDNKYIYVPNMIADRTDIREQNNLENRVGTRFIGIYGDPDTYEVREDFLDLCN